MQYWQRKVEAQNTLKAKDHRRKESTKKVKRGKTEIKTEQVGRNKRVEKMEVRKVESRAVDRQAEEVEAERVEAVEADVLVVAGGENDEMKFPKMFLLNT